MSSNLFSKPYREIRISGLDTVLVYSKRLNQTMVIFLHEGEETRIPLNGICLKNSDIEAIKGKINGTKLENAVAYFTHDYDKGGDVVVSAEIKGKELDYAVSVEEEQGELKLVMLPSLLLEANKVNQFKKIDNRKNFEYNVFDEPKKKPKKQERETETPEIYM